MTLLLNNNDIAGLITMRECIDVLEEGYREHGHGRAVHQRRSNIIVSTGSAPKKGAWGASCRPSGFFRTSRRKSKMTLRREGL